MLLIAIDHIVAILPQSSTSSPTMVTSDGRGQLQSSLERFVAIKTALCDRLVSGTGETDLLILEISSKINENVKILDFSHMLLLPEMTSFVVTASKCAIGKPTKTKCRTNVALPNDQNILLSINSFRSLTAVQLCFGFLNSIMTIDPNKNTMFVGDWMMSLLKGKSL